jgi:hypothetical protein
VFVVLDLRENAFGENRRPMLLAKLIANDNQAFPRRLLASRSDLVSNGVG